MTHPPQPDLETAPPVSLQRLANIVATLRHPVRGCPWDLEQDHASIKAYAIEEAYEVVDAIDRGDPRELCTELGDLLLQVLFHAQIAREAQRFELQDVIDAIGDKMIRRHPHVFGDVENADRPWVKSAWEKAKRDEGRARQLDGVPRSLPALMRADILTRKAAAVGFDWTQTAQVLDKIEEELGELRHAMSEQQPAATQEELGDLFFALANFARKLDIDPEEALRDTNDKFERRFRYIEDELVRQGRSPSEASLDEMEAIWQRAKTLDPPKEPPYGES